MRVLLFGLLCCWLRPAVAQAPCEDPFADAPDLAFSTQGWATDFCMHNVPYAEIRSGGPPRDGIPPIDHPTFVTPEAADQWIADKEPVLLLRIGEDARAYPLQILTWHEIVNDEVGGVPVAVTFCPLCYAALVYERPEVQGRRLTFGTSGNLRNSDLVMWDRQTESWWQQFSGEAIVGQLTGTRLKAVPAALVSWKIFKTEYPQGRVLSRDTGHTRPYGRNPYRGYDDVTQRPWAYEGVTGAALRPMEHVVGLELGPAARAYPRRTLQKKRVFNDTLDATPVVVFWAKGTASALDTEEISQGRDIGMIGAFVRTVADRTLTFEPAKADRFKDQETGSVWNILGVAVAGPMAGTRLEPVVHHNVFWFVWSAFKPDGTLHP